MRNKEPDITERERNKPARRSLYSVNVLIPNLASPPGTRAFVPHCFTQTQTRRLAGGKLSAGEGVPNH